MSKSVAVVDAKVLVKGATVEIVESLRNVEN